MAEKNLPHHHGNIKVEAKLGKELDNIENFQTVANVFKQLSDSSRLRIYWLLCHCEECVINISAMVNMSSPAVCHHLRQLKDSGLIVSRRVGKEVYYKAASKEENRYLDRAVEKIMEVSCPNHDHENNEQCKASENSEHRSEQAQLMETIHEYLVQNLDSRITIEDLSKRFHINTTTLKELFKRIYGTSPAAHIKEHRMKRAAFLLNNTEQSITEIAKNVGYQNTGKFSEAFKEVYHILPKEYRKNGQA